MRQVRVVYNPKARKGSFVNKLDRFVELAQVHGCRVSLCRLSGTDVDSEQIVAGLRDDAALIAVGGDGTFQLVADTIIKYELDWPLGLLPYGTSNDFADFCGLDPNPLNFFRYLTEGNIHPIDVGQAGDKIFVNVFSAGQLTRSSHMVERRFKNQLGMLAYYLHSVGSLPRIAPFKLRLQGQVNLETKCLLFLATNGGSAGGFKHLAPKAKLNDGLLEVIIVRECSLAEMATVFLAVLRGEHHNNPSVVYTQVSSIEVFGPSGLETDVDGERGPKLPLKIQVLPKRLRLVGPDFGKGSTPN